MPHVLSLTSRYIVMELSCSCMSHRHRVFCLPLLCHNQLSNGTVAADGSIFNISLMLEWHGMCHRHGVGSLPIQLAINLRFRTTPSTGVLIQTLSAKSQCLVIASCLTRLLA